VLAHGGSSSGGEALVGVCNARIQLELGLHSRTVNSSNTTGTMNVV
jgi:hypothetical protein